MSTQPKHCYTLEEYLELERNSETRYEYWNGEVYVMSGGTQAHELITTNIHDLLAAQLAGKGCRAYPSGMQIKVPAAPPYHYADGSVVCGKAEIEEFNNNHLLLNPVLIYEVLSPSTEAFDRGDKFTYYKSIPSLREYLLAAQHRPHITQYFKKTTDDWDYKEINGLDARIHCQA